MKMLKSPTGSQASPKAGTFSANSPTGSRSSIKGGMCPGKTPASTRNTKVVESMVSPKKGGAPATTPKGSMFGFGVKAAAQGAAIGATDG